MEFNPLWMFLPLFILILSGYPVGLVLGGVGLAVGFFFWGPNIISMFAKRIFTIQTDFLIVAVPLFVLMGNILVKSGAAEKLYAALHLWLGPLRGGLALATVVICTIFAAATGVAGAEIITMGIIALPAMIKHRYNKVLSAGTIMASGGLGVLIPPSILLVIYGSYAEISVGKLFMACVFPGLILATLYMAYIIIRTGLQPELGPVMPKEERQVPFRRKAFLLVSSIIPPVCLIFAVLGTILLGITTPTEAAAMGAVGSIVIAIANHRFNWPMAKEAMYSTAKTFGMLGLLIAGAHSFMGAFLGLGGREVVSNLLLGLPFGPAGILVVTMVILFLLGMFIGPVPIIMLCVPLFSPIINQLSFDPLWFAVLFNFNLQMSYITPPFGYAIFYLKGVAPSDVTLGDIIRSGLPFVGLIMIGLAICIAFPQTSLWLPSIMID